MIREEGRGVLSTIGATPLIRLERLFPESGAHLWAKLENANPGGSGKDRAALSMLVGAIREGTVVPGRSTVVESSSGNLGIGLAQVCRWFDLQLICVVDPKITAQNLAVLEAYGARVEMVTECDNEQGDYLAARLARVRQLVRELPDAYWPNQYANIRNAQGQGQVMREVLAALVRVDFLFIATGSCGTIRGCSAVVVELGLDTHIVAVDAEGSAVFGAPGCARLVPGHGAAIRPALYTEGMADSVVQVSDRECIAGCRHLVQSEAVLAGGSSGAVVAAVGRRLADMPHGARCVLVLADRGERYLQTVYSDPWVLQHFGAIPSLTMGAVPC